MKLYTAAQMHAVDRLAIEREGIPGEALMERAGQAVAAEAATMLGDRAGERPILVLCGRGNNGGDGFAAARILIEQGIATVAVLAGARDRVAGAACLHLEAALEAGLPVIELAEDRPRPGDWHEVEESARAAGLIIDALLGTGVTGEVTGLTADLIALANRMRAERGIPVLAVDIPSGILADTGAVAGVAVEADTTVTMVGPKLGLALYPGAAHAGRVVVADLGVPARGLETSPAEATLLDPALARAWLPVRPPEAHKGDFGTVLVVAGCSGMIGAAYLAAQAALRAGAGLVRAAVPQSLQDVLAAKGTEFMTAPLPETHERTISADAVAGALELAANATAVVLGPGLSRNESTQQFVREFVARLERPLLVDADGLNALAGHRRVLGTRPAPTVITPHPGEMARLLGWSAIQVQTDRLAAVREAARGLGCIALLKGARTLVAAPQGNLLVNPTGNPGMATGGTGDVLSGMIGAFLGMGVSPLQAAGLGAYLHGLAGDLAAERLSMPALIAGDLLDSLPEAFRRLLADELGPPYPPAVGTG